MSNVHVFVRCVPSVKECLIPNERDYPDDMRIYKLKEILCNENPYICIVGVTDEDISNLYREMIALNDELDKKWLKKKWLVSITNFKTIFWFKDLRSCKIFEDVYMDETNELIIEQYNRIFESIAGNNLCISLNDFRGMVCRLPYDMSVVAKKGNHGGRTF